MRSVPVPFLTVTGTNALNLAIRERKKEGRSAIVLTHRPMAIAECDIVLVMEDGKATAFGPKDDVLKSKVKNAPRVTRVQAESAT